MERNSNLLIIDDEEKVITSLDAFFRVLSKRESDIFTV